MKKAKEKATLFVLVDKEQALYLVDLLGSFFFPALVFF